MSKLVRDDVKKTIFRMAFPMLLGTFAMNAYHLTDTWFVSKLGTQALAAMGFTFPVIMLLHFIARALGTGAMTVIAHALGRKDEKLAAVLTTHAFLLAAVSVIIILIVGLMTIRPLFVFLGAGPETLPLVEEYMRIWYWGMLFMVFPTMANDIIIATGDTKCASFLIVGGTITNMILDPLFIFGLMGVPRMGIGGAALATVIARSFWTIGAGYVLYNRHHLISLLFYSWKQIAASWGKILYVSVPNVLSMMLVPISQAVIMRVIAGFGAAAVAASGAANRIEMFAFMIPMTVGMSLGPFVGQNYGAGRIDRIKTACKATTFFAVSFGFATALVFFAAAPYFARIFSQDPEVIKVMIQYVRIISFGYGMAEVHRYAGFYLTGMHRPIDAAILHALRVLVFLIPLSFLGARFMGVRGVFLGRLATDIISGVIGIFYVIRVLKIVVKIRKEDKRAEGFSFPDKAVGSPNLLLGEG